MFHTRVLAQLITLIIVVSLTALPSAAFPTATAPSLGMADSFAILAGTPNITNVSPSVIIGDVGLSPATGAAIELTCAEVTGTIYSVDAAGPLPCRVEDDALLTTAKTDLSNAYDALSAASNVCTGDYGDVVHELAGDTLVPGVYCAKEFTLSGTLTLNGAESDVWVFRTTEQLTTFDSANVVLSTGGIPCNVWWRIGSSAVLGTNSSLAGNILALTSISLATGANLDGRALAQNGAVTLDQSTITIPICTPTAVELLYFQADLLSDHQVQLKWATALEVDNFGFNLYRANINDWRSATLIHFEPATTQGSGSGASYVYVDTVPYEGPWWYWLSDVDTQGRETLHDSAVYITVQSNNILYYSYFPVITQ